MKEYEDILIKFIQNFRNEGAELVFFFDGPTQTSKYDTWVKRRLEKLQRVYILLDGLENGESVWRLEQNERLFILPTSLRFLTQCTAKEFGCKVK